VSYGERNQLAKAAVCYELTLQVSNVQWFRGGLVFKAHRLLYHATLGLRVIKKKKKKAVCYKLTLQIPTRPRKVDIRLPGKGNSNSHGARPVY